ncbi:hypothetical protein C8Q80DRAFT_1265590 [Daedaleopsis nitida]|nr:hypothetical protein C8Q80DRAFT_1265590 [Daedaleopsis nitida]
MSAPINRLYPEILAMIFANLRTPTRSNDVLVSAMLVCHRWYSVALDTVSLWTEVDVTYQAKFNPKQLLARSKAAPIHLRLSIDKEERDMSMLHWIVRHGHRIQQLALCARTSYGTFSVSLPMVDMPRLRCLAAGRRPP